MTQLTLTRTYRTTIPKEVREKLGLRPQDVLLWEVQEKSVRS